MKNRIESLDGLKGIMCIVTHWRFENELIQFIQPCLSRGAEMFIAI